MPSSDVAVNGAVLADFPGSVVVSSGPLLTSPLATSGGDLSPAFFCIYYRSPCIGVSGHNHSDIWV